MILLEILFDSFFDCGLWGIIFGPIVLACYIFVIAAIGFGAFYLVDSSFVVPQESEAVVIGRDFTPMHFIPVCVSNGKTTTVIMNCIPNTWTLYFRIADGMEDGVSVSQRYYNETTNGAIREIKFKQGRFSKEIYITEIN